MVIIHVLDIYQASLIFCFWPSRLRKKSTLLTRKAVLSSGVLMSGTVCPPCQFFNRAESSRTPKRNWDSNACGSPEPDSWRGGPTLRRPPLPKATRMNATLHPQHAYRRTSDRTSYNQPSPDDGMTHNSATRPDKSTPNLRFLGLRLPYS